MAAQHEISPKKCHVWKPASLTKWPTAEKQAKLDPDRRLLETLSALKEHFVPFSSGLKGCFGK